MIPPGVFDLISSHLKQDQTPSSFFNRICGEAYFRQPPFDMLYKLKETEQSPVYHPEGNVWNHTMLVYLMRRRGSDIKARMTVFSCGRCCFTISANPARRKSASECRKARTTGRGQAGGRTEYQAVFRKMQ